VPQGTEGRVLLVDGFTWTRYRVAFDNGRDLGSIDGSHLCRPKDYETALRRREAAATEEAVVATNGDEPGESAASSGEGAVVNGVTIPAHLLERSRRARERLAAAS
jgi:hypothetical protein